MDEQRAKGNGLKYDYSNLQEWIDGYDVLVAMDGATEEAQREVQFDCARCRTSWSCPTLTPEQRREVADLWRQKLLHDVFAFFRSAGFTFAAAKPTMLHITTVPGKCHKCSKALPGDSEQAVCRCRSLNLDW